MAYCNAEIVCDPEEVAAGMAQINADERLAGSLSAGMSEQVRASIAKRVLLRFTPFRVVSWDHGKLGGFYAMLQYGVFFPFGGLKYPPGEQNSNVSDWDLSAAQAARLFLGVAF